jgi:hypothetical protein
MAIYRHRNVRGLSEIAQSHRLSNQIEFSGNNESLDVPRGIVFLELLILEAGKTVTIRDGEGRTISTGLTSFSQDYSPLRCDYGIEFIGDIVFAKGFVLEDVFLA